MNDPEVIEKTILIADDHPIFRQGLKQIVGSLPWVRVVAEADTGDVALAQIKYHNPDVVILDIAMPVMDGLEVLERIGALDSTPAVIIVTSYDDSAYLDRAMALGARAYVLKDRAAEDLITCLETVRGGELYITPSLGRHTPQLPQVGPVSPATLDTLTPAEHNVLARVAEFKTSKEIAIDLGISYRTVQNHRANICGKLGLHGPHQLTAFAREHGDLLRKPSR